MLKLLQSGMVLHSKLSHLTTLLPNGTPVCSMMVPLSVGSAWIREQNDSKAAGRWDLTAFTTRWWEISWVFDPGSALSCQHAPCSFGQCL